jgi:hypothetical protein
VIVLLDPSRLGVHGHSTRVKVLVLRDSEHRCGCEVTGMILLSDLKGAMRLDRSKDMSMHVSTCTSYDFNALTPVVWKLRR